MKRFLLYFLEIITSSIDPLFYRKIVKRSAISAFVYFSLFTFLYGVVVTVGGLVWLSKQYEPALAELQKTIPALSLNIEQGQLTITPPQSLNLGDEDFPVIIDTTKSVLEESHHLSHYKKAIFVSRTKAIVKKSDFETREFYFSALPDFQLALQDVANALIHYKQVILWTAFSLIALVIFPTLWLMVIPLLLLFSLGLLIFSKIIRAPLTYGQTTTIAFYAITLPTLLQTGLFLRGIYSLRIFFAVYLIWSLAAILVNRFSKSENNSQSPRAKDHVEA